MPLELARLSCALAQRSSRLQYYQNINWISTPESLSPESPTAVTDTTCRSAQLLELALYYARRVVF
jgi:hypothetical protein